jgi:predicted ATPase
MRRYILTGAPGAGKTVILRRLERDGFAVVEEAATDHIALAGAEGVERHWEAPLFIDEIVALQRARQLRADAWPDDVVVFDRSPICTWALCQFLGRDPPRRLISEVERVRRESIYEPRVLFVENLGFVTPTEARRISFEDTLRFEQVHAEVYRDFGFTCVPIAPGDVAARVAAVRREIG